MFNFFSVVAVHEPINVHAVNECNMSVGLV